MFELNDQYNKEITNLQPLISNLSKQNVRKEI